MIGVTWHPATNYEAPDYGEYEVDKLTNCELQGRFLNFNEGQIAIQNGGSIDIEAI